MDSLSNLALKGHFEELKKKFDRKGMVRAGEGTSKAILEIVGKAVGMAEDIYEHDPEFFSDDHREDYQQMIKTMNQLGYSYQGHPDLMEGTEQPVKFTKKPMKKAGKAAVKGSGEEEDRRVG